MTVGKGTALLRGVVWLLLAVLAGCAVSPQEIETEELLRLLERDQQIIESLREPIEGPVSLSDVMARAVLTNLDQKVTNLEEALALGTFELARFDMLPTAAISGTYYERNNENASRSISVLTRRESLEASTSQEQIRAVSDVQLSWSLLDFGVSYYQAKQDADRYLIAINNRRKAMIDLLQEARSSFWRALAAQRLREPVATIIEEALVAYDEVNQGIEERIYPNLVEALQLKKDLFTLIGDLERLQNDLEQSMILLKNFINAPSEAEITLVDPGELPGLPPLDLDQELMELTALVNSVDVIEEAYNARIEYAETRKALLRMLPGLELGFSGNYNTNKYLYNNDWNEASVRISWNLLRLASTGTTLRSTRIRNELQLQRRLAANMAVITRLNVALRQYANQLRQLEQAREIQSIDQQISRLTANAVSTSAESQVNFVRSEVEALTAELAYLDSYAQTQEAYGTVLVSLGFDPLPLDYNAYSVDELSELLAGTNRRWSSGDFPLDPDLLEGRQQADLVGESPAPGPEPPPAAAAEPAAAPPQLEGASASAAPAERVVAAETAPEAPEDGATFVEAQLNEFLAQWLQSWRDQDLDGYFAHYHPAFLPAYQDTAVEWREERRARIGSPAWIELDLEDLEISRLEAEGQVNLRFWLHYNSPDYADETLKELVLVYDDGRWRIVTERSLIMMVIRA